MTDLWDQCRETQVLPRKEDLESALETVDWTKVSIEGCTVCIPAGMELDLGAAAKGYIGDELQKYLEEQGCPAALLNLGGNIVTLGKKPDKKTWRIGARDPEGTASDITQMLSFSGSGTVVTSGIYERRVLIDGKEYHHLLDPKTGYPADTGLYSVTVIAPSSALADMLSTACFVLGTTEGMALLEKMEGAEGLFLLTDGSVVLTEGMKKHLE